jgi:hypothetical protein
MFARSACSVLFSEPVSKRLTKKPRAWLRALCASGFAASLSVLSLCLSLCLSLSACGNDADKPVAAPTTTAEQINAAPPAPWAVPQNASIQAGTQAAQTAQAALPPNTVQSPPPPAVQAGAAAPDSLATPVIHTVD